MLPSSNKVATTTTTNPFSAIRLFKQNDWNNTTQEKCNANSFTARTRDLPQNLIMERIVSCTNRHLRACTFSSVSIQGTLFVNAGTKCLFSNERVIGHRTG